MTAQKAALFNTQVGQFSTDQVGQFYSAVNRCSCRKPGIGLAMQAKKRFPEIDFARSVLVGDSDSDMEMGKTLGMFTVRIHQGSANVVGDLIYTSLIEFVRSI
jgi:D-glycero-D-manno-heptose 1,7-bisphosphate phosphatase